MANSRSQQEEIGSWRDRIDKVLLEKGCCNNCKTDSGPCCGEQLSIRELLSRIIQDVKGLKQARGERRVQR